MSSIWCLCQAAVQVARHKPFLRAPGGKRRETEEIEIGTCSIPAPYGERAENYIYQTEAAGTPVGVVITSEGKAHTYTDTNLREGPGAETASLAVLPANAQVLIWGYTENGWTKVFYRESDLSGEGQESAQTIFERYIKTDLLIKTGL